MSRDTPPLQDASGNPTKESGAHICGRVVKNRGGGWCEKGPARGVPGLPCRSHGGAAPQVIRKAENALLETGLRKILTTKYGRDTPITDPLTAMQELAGRVRAWSEFLEDSLTELRSSSQWSTEQINGIAQLFEGSLGQLRGTLKDMASMKIDERLIAIESGKVTMMRRALEAGLVAAGVTPASPAGRNAMAAMSKSVRTLQGEAAGY